MTARNCLKCGREFESEGPGNRLCCFCNRNNVVLRQVRKEPPVQRRGYDPLGKEINRQKRRDE